MNHKKLAVADSYMDLLSEAISNKTATLWPESPLHQKQTGTSYNELVLMPYILWKSLQLNHKNTISLSKIHDICFAASCTFHAYKAGSCFPYKPLANTFLRAAYKIHLNNSISFQWLSYIDSLYVKFDQALFEQHNHYSLDHYEKTKVIPLYPNKNILTDISIGPKIGSLLVLAQLNVLPTSSDVQRIEHFINSFIIAHQLLQGLKTWKNDLKNKYISPVITCLLQHYNIQSSDNISQLESVFWNTCVPIMLQEILYYIEQATEALEKATLIHNKINFLIIIRDMLYQAKQFQIKRNAYIKKEPSSKEPLKQSTTNHPSPYM